jgi:hypothetical protein
VSEDFPEAEGCAPASAGKKTRPVSGGRPGTGFRTFCEDIHTMISEEQVLCNIVMNHASKQPATTTLGRDEIQIYQALAIWEAESSCHKSKIVDILSDVFECDPERAIEWGGVVRRVAPQFRRV